MLAFPLWQRRSANNRSLVNMTLFSRMLSLNMSRSRKTRELQFDTQKSLGRKEPVPFDPLSINTYAARGSDDARSGCLTSLRTAKVIMSRAIPVITMLIPTSVPITHNEFDGH